MPCKMFHVEHFTGFSLFSVLYTSVAYSLAGSCGGVVGCCTGRPSLPTGMRTMYSRQLLHLGIKNIYLGPTLPSFVSENVLNYLVENFQISPTGTPEEDLKKILEK